MMTPKQKRRVTADWSKIAKEKVKVELISSAFFAYGSEIACLRLEHVMRKGRAEYSTNLKTWYFCLETNL